MVFSPATQILPQRGFRRERCEADRRFHASCRGSSSSRGPETAAGTEPIALLASEVGSGLGELVGSELVNESSSDAAGTPSWLQIKIASCGRDVPSSTRGGAGRPDRRAQGGFIVAPPPGTRRRRLEKASAETKKTAAVGRQNVHHDFATHQNRVGDELHVREGRKTATPLPMRPRLPSWDEIEE